MWLRLGLVLVSAGLLWASFFPGFGGLVWVALAPFFFALDGAGAKRGAFLGFIFGFVFFLLEFSPFLSLRPFIGPATYAIIVILAVYGGAFLCVFGLVGGWRSFVLMWSGGWALLEAARAAGPFGFSFGSVPVALAGSPFIAAAGIAGPWLLSLAISLTAAALVKARQNPKLLLLAILGPILLFLVGQIPTTKKVGEVKLALIQPDIPQIDRLDRTKLPEILARYEHLLSQVPAGVDLVVIPENATPAFLRIERQYLEPFLRAAREKGVPLLVGTADLEDGEIRNTMVLLTPDGRETVAYAKVHLVPFGEYVPARSVWEKIGFGAVIDRFLPYDQTPGKQLEPVGIYGVLICFESTVAGLSRVLARKGAELILVATNDAWFGRTRILWEHYALGALRAAETGRVVVQAGQTGITGAWGPTGKEIVRFPLAAGVYTVQLPRLRGFTPYVWVGDLPALLLAGGLCSLALIKKPRPQRGFPPQRSAAKTRVS